MRTMMKVQIPVGPGNAAVANGAIQQIMRSTIDSLKPEASYFFPEDGVRTALFVFDMKSPSDIPSICEPFFTQCEAKVEFFPVMNLEDLQVGLQRVQARV